MSKKPMQSANGKFGGVRRDQSFHQYQPQKRKPMTNKPINRISKRDVEFFEVCRADGDLNLLDVYQRLATKSAFYPGQGTPIGLVYCALKLNGEAGEFAEHVGKAMRDDNFVSVEWLDENHHVLSLEVETLTPERRAFLIKEVGDQLWYLSAICRELGITLSEAALQNLEKLHDRGKRDVMQGSGDDR